jgi:hypothetical protein
VETVLLDTPEPPAFETWLRNQRTSFSGTFGANQRWGSVKASASQLKDKQPLLCGG